MVTAANCAFANAHCSFGETVPRPRRDGLATSPDAPRLQDLSTKEVKGTEVRLPLDLCGFSADMKHFGGLHDADTRSTRFQVGGTRPPRRPEQINETYEELIEAQGDLMPEGIHPA
jgi:hypothetical protein